jgi:acetolactate synthase small subunit
MSVPPATVHPSSTATLVVVLHDRQGVVERVLAAARRQGCALTTLALDAAGEDGLARLRLTVSGGQPARLAKQLARLVDVMEVIDATSRSKSDSATAADIALTPFRSQADGTSPIDNDTDTPKTPTEE